MAKVKIRATVESEQVNIPESRGGDHDRVEYEVASVSTLMDANTCAKALCETYPRNTVLQILSKDDNGHMAIVKEYKGKKPASIGAGEEKAEKKKKEPKDAA